MSGPSLEGFTQKPVVARTMEVAYPNVASAVQDQSNFEQNDALTVIPVSPATFEAEAVDGLTVHIGIDVAGESVNLTAGTWRVRFEALAFHATLAHGPNIAVVNGLAGTDIMLLFDSGAAGMNVFAIDGSHVSIEKVYTSNDPIVARLRLGSEQGNLTSFTNVSLTFTKLMSR